MLDLFLVWVKRTPPPPVQLGSESPGLKIVYSSYLSRKRYWTCRVTIYTSYIRHLFFFSTAKEGSYNLSPSRGSKVNTATTHVYWATILLLFLPIHKFFLVEMLAFFKCKQHGLHQFPRPKENSNFGQIRTRNEKLKNDHFTYWTKSHMRISSFNK